MIGQTIYFDKPGKKNTKETIQIAKKRAQELGIKTIVISSSGGYTAKLALEEIKDPIIIDFCEKNLRSLKNSGD